jgi:hypothetical protein
MKQPWPKNPFGPVPIRLFAMGLYDAGIENLRSRYGRDQIHIILFDDLRKRPKRVLKDVTRFLGVDASFAFRATRKVHNPTKTLGLIGEREREDLIDLYRPSLENTAEILGRDLSHWIN